MQRARSSLARAVRALLATTLLGTMAAPSDAAERARTLGGDVRLLIAGVIDGRIEAGLEIRLAPGWKTYWRYPGDSGIPPTIDFSGSDNVADARLLFPIPVRFSDGLGTAIGYVAPIVLPIEARLAEPGRGGHLRVHAMLGICREICVPVDVTLDAAIDPGPLDAVAAATLRAARATVPVEAGAEAPLAVVDMALDRSTSPATVTVDTRIADAAAPIDLLVEGPPGSALPLPELVSREGAKAIFRFTLDGLPTGVAPSGAALLFTLINGPRAIEASRSLP